MTNFYQYYVEGECEKRLVDELKTYEGMHVIPGKVDVFNITQEKITDLRLRSLRNNTTVILIFDTDLPCSEILISNVDKLKTYPTIKAVWCVPQVHNLEDELIRLRARLSNR